MDKVDTVQEHMGKVTEIWKLEERITKEIRKIKHTKRKQRMLMMDSK